MVLLGEYLTKGRTDIYMKLKRWQNDSTVTEIRPGVTAGLGE